MTPAMRARFGVEGDWAMTVEHRIRWSECDYNGHVNHAAYLTLCEDLRIEHWYSLGQALAPGRPQLVVTQLDVRYLRGLDFREDVLLALRVPSLRRSSFIHEYAFWRGGCVFTCRAVAVVVTPDGSKSMAIPPEARRLLIERDRAREEG